MIDWFIVFLLLVFVLVVVFFVVRDYLLPWRNLEKMVNDLADGKRPTTFVFHGARRFMRVALSLEKLSDEQRKLQKQISQEEFNLQAVLSNMVEGVMVVDSQHVIRLVNASFIKFFNLRNSPIRQTVLGALREASIEELLRATSQTGQIQTREISIPGDLPSTPLYFAVSSVPIKKDDGTISGMLTVFHDISRLRQLEEVRREFVANVSHELRTPLSIFHGYVENLIDAPDMEREERIEVYEILQRHSHRLNALLEDLLTITRLEARNEKLDLAEISLDRFLAQFVREWAGKAAEKKIRLTTRVEEGLPALKADEFRIGQVLNNLLENAFRYTAEGGNVEISARMEEGHIVVQVKDDGVGIPFSDLQHIFKRFYRVEKARSRDKGGTGLGLSIVKRIMMLHGGSVEAKSELGKGTAIVLRFSGNPPQQD